MKGPTIPPTMMMNSHQQQGRKSKAKAKAKPTKRKNTPRAPSASRAVSSSGKGGKKGGGGVKKLKKGPVGHVKTQSTKKGAFTFTPNSNPNTQTNPGNVDPSPAPPLRARDATTYSTAARGGSSPTNPYKLQQQLLKSHKQSGLKPGASRPMSTGNMM